MKYYSFSWMGSKWIKAYPNNKNPETELTKLLGIKPTAVIEITEKEYKKRQSKK